MSIARDVRWEVWAESNPKAAKELEMIAIEELRLETLKTRNRDSLDFQEQPVWSIAEALMLAFRAGQESKS